MGPLFESLMTVSVLVYAQAASAEVGHFRTKAGAREVDLIVQRGDRRAVAMKVKLAGAVDEGDVRHLRWLVDHLGDDLLDAVVITTGAERVSPPGRDRRHPLLRYSVPDRAGHATSRLQPKFVTHIWQPNRYALVMSTADQWDFTVPDDDAELLAELHRHGVSPGRHLHVSVAPEERTSGSDDKHLPRRLSFAGSIHAEPDLSERTDDYLRGFGHA